MVAGAQLTAAEKGPGAILVVEDNGDDVEILRHAINGAGVESQFRFVRDGAEAIAYLKGEPPYADRAENPFPDVMLLDLILPKIDGFEVLEWMRKAAGCQTVKVVVWSGWAHDGQVKRAKEAGASLFVAKGIGGNDIMEVIAIFTGPALASTESPVSNLSVSEETPPGFVFQNSAVIGTRVKAR